MSHKLRVFAIAIAALLSLPLIASAAHWPNFGGDAGHSGNQPISIATTPIELAYDPVLDVGRIQTSLITSAGADPVLAYGKYVDIADNTNDETRIHIRNVKNGAEKVPAAQQNIDDNSGANDEDTLGPPNRTVTPVETSTSTGLGQVYVVHNDNDSAAQSGNGCQPTSTTTSQNDIAIAQFDETTGNQVKDVAVGRPAGRTLPDSTTSDPTCPVVDQATNGFTIESSPVITPPLDNAGRRIIAFVARRDAGGAGRVFTVEVQKSSETGSVLGTTLRCADRATGDTTPCYDYRDVTGLNTKASPTIAYLRDPGRETAPVIPYVVVPVDAPTGQSDVQSFKLEKLSDDGPKTTVDANPDITPGVPQTVSVPVKDDGTIPGQSGAAGDKAPSLFVPYARSSGDTVVRKYVQNGNNGTLTPAQGSSPTPVSGTVSDAIAVSELYLGGNDTRPGRVIVATDKNLHLLNSETLTPVDQFKDVANGETELTGGTTGFSRNVPMVSGNLIFITSDEGAQLVLRLTDAENVGENEFTEATQNNLSDYAIGQPSYSRGFLQFLTDRGVFVYNTGVVNKPPVASFTFAPNPARAGEAVAFDATGSTDEDGSIAKYQWEFGDGTSAEGSKPSHTYAKAGTYSVKLTVTDNRGATSTVTRDVVVGENKAPTASFVLAPNPVTAGQRVGFDGRGSSDPDGTIAKFEWDLDGNGVYEVDSGINPLVARQYTVPGVLNVKLRVTDNNGAQAETIRQLIVQAAPPPKCGTTAQRSARCSVERFTVKTRPKRDTTDPRRFTTTGRITPPSHLKRKDACKGRVTVIVKAGKNTISRRSNKVSSRCTFKSRVTFKDAKRFGKVKRLQISTRFQGNAVLQAKKGRLHFVRVR